MRYRVIVCKKLQPVTAVEGRRIIVAVIFEKSVLLRAAKVKLAPTPLLSYDIYNSNI